MLASILKSTIRCNKCNLRLVLEKYSHHQRNCRDHIECEWCSETYTSICDLSKHVFCIHQEEYDIFEQQYGQSGDGEDVIEMDEVISNVCNNCGECFSTSKNLNEHIPKCEIDEKNEVNCKIESICDEDTDVIKPVTVKPEHDKYYTCVSCNNNFNLSTLVDHIKTEHAETNVAMIPCSICGVIFMHTLTLFQHLDEHLKTSDEEYNGVFHECWICLKKFHENEALSVHMRLHKAKKTICPVCPRRFKEEITLRQHIMYHTELQYCCPRCDMTFNSYTNMLSHQNHHDTKESRYCIRCNRNFSSEQLFEKHMRLHGKRLMQKTYEENNLKMQQKPFGCSICMKCFSTAHALLTHTGAHKKTGKAKEPRKEPITSKIICAECGKRMSSQSNLRRHIRVVHVGKGVKK